MMFTKIEIVYSYVNIIIFFNAFGLNKNREKNISDEYMNAFVIVNDKHMLYVGYTFLRSILINMLKGQISFN